MLCSRMNVTEHSLSPRTLEVEVGGSLCVQNQPELVLKKERKGRGVKTFRTGDSWAKKYLSAKGPCGIA